MNYRPHDLTHQLRAIHARHQAAHARMSVARFIACAVFALTAGVGVGCICAAAGFGPVPTLILIVVWAIYTIRILSSSVR